ncbi:MAG: CPBP family intramembrane metalloprotease [Chloroflexi bacterium]|nr:CPBP family intramembrane metalloprotease [Chloroflexota bacterium]
MQTQRRAAVTALLEIAVMFLPGIPAYLWFWHNVSETTAEIAQVVVYFYFLAGCLFIGSRRWNLDQLGLNRRGMALSLICGSSLFAVLFLGRWALNLPIEFQPITIERFVFDLVFYFALVAFVEELLFRGLLYRALADFRGTRLAIWGTAVAFGIYHIGGQGILGGFGTALIGLLFAAIRWRAGGIGGLVVIHGLYDIIAVEGWRNLETIQVVDQLQTINRPLAIICDIILLSVFLYLWKLHPMIMSRWNKVVLND